MNVQYLELTPRGRGAISVVGVRGDDARKCLDRLFSPASSKSFLSLSDDSIVYGTWNSTGEDLLVVQTAADSFEVQCHGSLAAVASVKADLQSGGAAESADSSAWLPAGNEYQAEIVVAMQACTTQRTASHLLRQYHLWATANLQDRAVVEQALSFATFGEKLTSPWRIVLCGRPNVGKSSLINALSGFQRAIVHDTAGTTRDLVSQQTAIDGWPVELIDSAGIRDAENQIEKAGVAKAVEIIKQADLVLHLVDAAADCPFEPEVSQHRAGIIVINKVDLCQSPKVPNVSCPVIEVSAKTGRGIEELFDLISKVLVPAEPKPDQIVPVTKNLQRILDLAR